MTVVVDRDRGELARTRRLGLARFERAVHREISRRGGQKPSLRILRALFTALGWNACSCCSPTGGTPQRKLADTEQRMTGVLDELEPTGLVTSIPGLSAVGAAAILAETGGLPRIFAVRDLQRAAVPSDSRHMRLLEIWGCRCARPPRHAPPPCVSDPLVRPRSTRRNRTLSPAGRGGCPLLMAAKLTESGSGMSTKGVLALGGVSNQRPMREVPRPCHPRTTGATRSRRLWETIPGTPLAPYRSRVGGIRDLGRRHGDVMDAAPEGRACAGSLASPRRVAAVTAKRSGRRRADAADRELRRRRLRSR
jgi:hypothetical protein